MPDDHLLFRIILEAKEDGDDVDKDELTKLTIDIPHKLIEMLNNIII